MKKFWSGAMRSITECNRGYLLLCVVLLPVAVFFSFAKPWAVGFDFWETAATVRELSVDPLHPSNPIVTLAGDTSPRFVPYTVFWGLFKRITRLGIFATMGIAGLVNYFIFAVGLYRFISKQFKMDSLPTYTFLTMLLLWGRGYGWANAYHMEMFFISLPYVGFFAFGLSMHALYYISCYCEDDRWQALFVYSLLSVIVFVTHPITGAFCYVAASAILLACGDLKKTVLLQFIPLVAFGLCLLWPYFSYWEVFTKGTGQTWFQSALFSGRRPALGSSIIGFPIVLLYALKKKHLFLLYGSIFCSFIYVASGHFGITIGGRFIFFAVFFLHLATALYIKQRNIFSLQRIRDSFRTDGIMLLLICVLVGPALGYRLKEIERHARRFVDMPLDIHGYHSPVKPFFFLSEHLSRSDIVLVPVYEGWVVPAITGAKTVGLQKLNPLMVDEGKQRNEDVTAFFEAPLSIEERRALIDKYHATHIVIDLSYQHTYSG